MFTRVFQSVTQRPNKTMTLVFKKTASTVIEFLFFYPNYLGSVFLCPDLGPFLSEYLLRKRGTDVNAVRMQIGVVGSFLGTPSPKFVAPQKTIFACRNAQLLHRPQHTLMNILIELPNLFRLWHAVKVDCCKIERRNNHFGAEA